MEKGEQTITAESGIIYKIYKISCAVRRIGEYQDLLKYEQPLEYHLIRPNPRRRWRLAIRPPPPSAGSRKPEGRQPTKGHEPVENVRRRVQRKYRRSPAARSQGTKNRDNTFKKCDTED